MFLEYYRNSFQYQYILYNMSSGYLCTGICMQENIIKRKIITIKTNTHISKNVRKINFFILIFKLIELVPCFDATILYLCTYRGDSFLYLKIDKKTELVK